MRGKKQNPLQIQMPRTASEFEAVGHRLTRMYKLQGEIKPIRVDEDGCTFILSWDMPKQALALLERNYPNDMREVGLWLPQALKDKQECGELQLSFGTTRSIHFNTLGYLEKLSDRHSLAAMCCDSVYIAANELITSDFPSGMWPQNRTNNKTPNRQEYCWNVSPTDLNILLDNYEEFEKPLPKTPRQILARYKAVRDRIEKTTPEEMQAAAFAGYCKLQNPRGTMIANPMMCTLTSLRDILETKEQSANPDFWNKVFEMIDKNIVAPAGHVPRVGERVSWTELILNHNPGDR